jgi:hypothetical protein
MPSLGLRVLITGACGIGVFLLLQLTTWYNLRGAYNVCRRQDNTQRTLNIVKGQIDEYRVKFDKLPDSLDLLQDAEIWPIKLDKPVRDGWDHELFFQATTEGFELLSYGKDGKPGGIGLDADLTSDSESRKNALPTLIQYFGESDKEEVDRSGFFIPIMLLAGSSSIAMYMGFTDRHKRDKPVSVSWVVAQLICLVVISTLVGILLVPLHVPSGH